MIQNIILIELLNTEFNVGVVNFLNKEYIITGLTYQILYDIGPFIRFIL